MVAILHPISMNLDSYDRYEQALSNYIKYMSLRHKLTEIQPIPWNITKEHTTEIDITRTLRHVEGWNFVHGLILRSGIHFSHPQPQTCTGTCIKRNIYGVSTYNVFLVTNATALTKKIRSNYPMSKWTWPPSWSRTLRLSNMTLWHVSGISRTPKMDKASSRT